MRLVTALAVALALGAETVLRAGDQPEPPLPEPAAFLAAARERLVIAAADYIRFSHRERSTEIRFNPFGNLGTWPVVLSEVFPSADDRLTYRRILERDGKAVSDLDEQDRKYRARMKGASSARAMQEANVRQTLDLFTFALESRATWAGQPAIVVRFAPKHGGQARTREARVAKAFSGRVWVHEREHDVMHVEAQAIEDVSFGMGLVGRLHKGSSVQFTRDKIQGAWLPTLTVFKGGGRVLLRRLDINFRREYFDYRPFDPADLPARLGWRP